MDNRANLPGLNVTGPPGQNWALAQVGARAAYANDVVAMFDGKSFPNLPHNLIHHHDNDQVNGVVMATVDGLALAAAALEYNAHIPPGDGVYAGLAVLFQAAIADTRHINTLNYFLNSIMVLSVQAPGGLPAAIRAGLGVVWNNFWQILAHRFRILEHNLTLHAPEAPDPNGLVWRTIEVLTTHRCRMKLRLVEPLVFGFCKPAPMVDIGCFDARGDIVPSVDKFFVSLRYSGQNDRMFNLNDMRGISVDAAVANTPFESYRLNVVGVTSTLHTMHIRNSSQDDLPRHLGLLDVVNTLLDEVSFARAAAEGVSAYATEATVSFRFEFRDKPRWVMFHTRRMQAPHQFERTYNDGAAITRLQLHLNTMSNVIDYYSRDYFERMNAFTSLHFKEYLPPIERRGGACVFAFSEMPNSYMASTNEMFGRLQCTYDVHDDGRPYLDYAHKFEVYCTLIYKDKILELNKNYAVSQLHLL